MICGSINNDDILYIYLFMQGNVEFNENGSRVSDSVDIYQYQEQGGTCIEKINFCSLMNYYII